jgi:hypothetical protein
MGFYMTEIVTYPFTETRCEHTHKKKGYGFRHNVGIRPNGMYLPSHKQNTLIDQSPDP